MEDEENVDQPTVSFHRQISLYPLVDDDDDDGVSVQACVVDDHTHLLTAMLAYFSTSFNLFNVSLVLPILGVVWKETSMTTSPVLFLQTDMEQVELKAATLVLCSSLGGVVLGQLLGGYLGDVRGRYPIVLCFIGVQVIASLGSATACGNSFFSMLFGIHESSWYNWGLAIWRFVMGIGAGGIYPLAAVLSAEQGPLQEIILRPQTSGLSGDHLSRLSSRLSNRSRGTSAVSSGGYDSEFRNFSQSNDGGSSSDSSTTIEEPEEDDYDDNESTGQKFQRLRRGTLAFSMQGFGFLSVPVCGLLLLHIFGPDNLDVVWRLLFAIGSLPGLLALLPLTSRRKRHHLQHLWENQNACFAGGDHHALENHDLEEGDGMIIVSPRRTLVSVEEAAEDVIADLEEPLLPQGDSSQFEGEDNSQCNASRGHENQVLRVGMTGVIRSIAAEPQLGCKVVGTAGTWFLFDLLFYGITQIQPLVLMAIGLGASDGSSSSNNGYSLLLHTAHGLLFVSTIALPGYLVGVLLMGRESCGIMTQTARRVQIQGFAAMALLYFTFGWFWNDLQMEHMKRHEWILVVVLFGLLCFFTNYGPNTTTFLLPSITYNNAHSRCTLNGLSAAMGKLGALLGVLVFNPIAKEWGRDKVVFLCGTVSVVACLLTHMFVQPPKMTMS